MSLLTVGVFGTSRKKQEKRVPIHPDQLGWIDEEIRDHLLFEEGYGLPFGMSDVELAKVSGGVLTRSELFQHCEVALLAKPVQGDFDDMKDGTIHWGWPHCVQQRRITQTAIDRKLTLIAWEAMHRWSAHGDWQMHIFQNNNEIAGYAGVHHAMNLMGIDGNYGPNRKAVVISFGSVSRGAIRALQARGVQEITVFTQRHYFLVADQMAGVNYLQFDQNEEGSLMTLHPEHESRPFVEELVDADIIVNGMLQDTDNPVMLVPEDQNDRLKPGCVIVDISCDEGMGFSFAKPTDFEVPMFKAGKVFYYAVDHTPSYLWNAATWEISNSLTPYLPIIMGGGEKWQESETIRRAIEIQDGVIQNPKINSFQNRSSEYPHLELPVES
ncbi:MAG: N(5)-(carboxyethyl)ornithine synthase [Lewinella sp.]|jgi:alanine dehydrogenase|uniref:N(5)-(carboxyethyl)ornithine synthase n=1 Tax=Lewinella sp. TaxID=2004506 RepID=UPI003D6ACD8F